MLSICSSPLLIVCTSLQTTGARLHNSSPRRPLPGRSAERRIPPPAFAATGNAGTYVFRLWDCLAPSVRAVRNSFARSISTREARAHHVPHRRSRRPRPPPCPLPRAGRRSYPSWRVLLGQTLMKSDKGPNKGEARYFRVRAQVGASWLNFGRNLGSAAEGAILYSCFQFCRGFHTKSYETNFPELLDRLVESLGLSERYTLANPSSVLATKHFTGDLREVFGKLWREFQDKCLPRLPSAEDDERVATVSAFLSQLSNMNHEQIRAQAEHISLPWRDQDGRLLCDLISDSMSFQPGQSPWDDDINVLRDIPAIRRYFCGKNKMGHPGVHQLVSPNTGMTDLLAAQTIRQRKQRELDHQAYVLYMALAEDEVHRGRFRQCVRDEMLAPFLDTGDNDFHPPLRPDTVKDIIGRMKRAVAHYLAEEGIVERPYELFCLEEGPALDGQYDVSDSVNSHFEQKAIATIDTPENRGAVRAADERIA